MTAERIKITYATLRNDNEELHALYEAGLEKAKGRLGAGPPQRRRRRGARRGRDVRGPLADRHRHPRRDVRQGHPQGRPGRDRGRPPRPARVVPPRLGAAPRDPQARRRADQRAPDGVLGPDGDRGGQDPPRGPGRGGGGRRPHPLLREDRRGQRVLRPPDGQPGRPRGPHPVDPAAARRVRGHQPVQLPDGAGRRAVGRGDDGRQHGRVQAGLGVGDDRRRDRRGLPRRGRARTACSTWSWARATPSATSSRRTRASTASCSPARTRWASSCSGRSRRATRGRASWRWAARTRRSSCGSADLEEAAEGIMRSAFGFGGQKCSANSRVYVERPVHDDLVRLLVEKTEQLVVGDPLPRTAFLGPVIDERAVKRHQQAVAEARRDGTVFTGGEHLTDGALARGYYVEPTVAGVPASHRLFQDELFAPFTTVAAVDSLDEALTLANDNVYGLTAGVYSEDQARDRPVPRGDPRGRPVRQPARRRDDRRLAGRPGVRRLEGLGLDREVGAVDVLRRADAAGAEPHDRRLTDARAGAGPRPRAGRPASSPAARCCPGRARRPSSSCRSACASNTPPEQLQVNAINQTTIPVVLVVNGKPRDMAPGTSQDLGVAELGPLPWDFRVTTVKGRELLRDTLEAGVVSRTNLGNGRGEMTGFLVPRRPVVRAAVHRDQRRELRPGTGPGRPRATATTSAARRRSARCPSGSAARRR